MKTLTSKIKKVCRAAFRSADNRHRLPWGTLLLVGMMMVASAGLMTLRDGKIAGRPVQAFSKETRAAGAATFHEKGCEHCHGVDGIGTDRGPDLSAVGKRWKKDRIELQIRNGGGGMPPFGGALQTDEVKELVDYLSAKRKAPKRTTPPPSAVKTRSDDSGL